MAPASVSIPGQVVDGLVRVIEDAGSVAMTMLSVSPGRMGWRGQGERTSHGAGSIGAGGNKRDGQHRRGAFGRPRRRRTAGAKAFARKIDASGHATKMAAEARRGVPRVDPRRGTITVRKYGETVFMPAMLHLRPNSADTYETSRAPSTCLCHSFCAVVQGRPRMLAAQKKRL
jgi:hypothetical protein